MIVGLSLCILISSIFLVPYTNEARAAHGKADILWKHASSGIIYIWLMDGIEVGEFGYVYTLEDTDWQMEGVGDFNGDGKADILWKHASSGIIYIWLMDDTGVANFGYVYTLEDTDWQMEGVGDFNCDGSGNGGGGNGGGNGLAVDGPCENCHGPRDDEIQHPGRDEIFDTADDAPVITTYWDGSWWDENHENDDDTDVQQGGHGDSDNEAALECTDCHDIPGNGGNHYDGIYNSIWANDDTRNSNTVHLKTEFFNPETSNAPGEWSIQVTFDKYCYNTCHINIGKRDMHHERDTTNEDDNYRSVELGSHLTTADGDMVPYPIDKDLTTDAIADNSNEEIDYAPCISCHDPHGTAATIDDDENNNNEKNNSNQMLRDEKKSKLCIACHY